MTNQELSALLIELLALPAETEWLEFKHNNCNPQEIGKYLSAIANSAALHGRECGYIVWGVEDGTHRVVGTTFKPGQAKGHGNEGLANWLTRLTTPQVNWAFHEFRHEGLDMVICVVPRATHAPIRFAGEEYIRVDSHKKKLKDFQAKEAALWATFAKNPFEKGIAMAGLPGDQVLSALDFVAFFDLVKTPLPEDQGGILARLVQEKMIVQRPGNRFDISNLGAILLAKDLSQFDRLHRKALRIIKYKGDRRTELEREWRDPPSQHGYAAGFEAAISYINSQLPQNEPIGQALRAEVRLYPEAAIRELVANALIHQDLTITGAGPMVELFSDRMEITNPGEPLVDTLRFIDTPPRTRNEDLAAVMRRMRICEEGGSGIDKVIEAVEGYQLPPPDFEVPPGSTRATLFAPRGLTGMLADERVRACYQHACLCYVSNQHMTNASLRKRFSIDEKNAATASRIIAETVKAGRIRLLDPDARRKNARYVPFWA